MMGQETLLQRRERLLGKAYRLFYERPLHIVHGEGVWLTDIDGQRYLDAYNNVPHVGHCHPRVINAIQSQAQILNTHTRYLHPLVLDYAERLTATLPEPLDTVMYACTGTEANELAIRVARAVTGNEGLIAVDHAYHGNSHITAQLSGEPMPGQCLDANIVTIPSPDTFRGQFREPDAGQRYAALVGGAISALAERGHRPAAFILDTLLSSNGLPTIPDHWLPDLMKQVKAAGGLLIADEVQAGFGRTGRFFWGFEALKVTPDLVTMGKPMGNGHPVSAVVMNHELSAQFRKRTHYFNTFGGNPVSCAAALAVLDVIKDEELQANALEVGRYLRSGLRGAIGGSGHVGDIRGQGLFNAIDLVVDQSGREPNANLAHGVVNGLRESGVLIGASGPHGNVLKLRSPMVFEREHADILIEKLAKVFKEQAN